MRRLAPLLAVLLTLASNAAPGETLPGLAETRVALVIGNARYRDSPLVNPVNDARALGKALRAAGFDVIELHDQGAVEMRRAIRDFGERLRGKGAGLFYFAGHGVQVNGRNYLVPVNADIKYEDEIEDQSVDVGLVLGKMENAKARVNLVILDACRNNPFARNNRAGQNGLAPMEAPIGSVIAFATSPGQVSSDGSGSNGLYTQYLVREIEQPGAKVEDVFKRVRAAVRVASQGRQIPWENTSLEGDFYFHFPMTGDSAALEKERSRRQEEAIQQAVANAVSRSREEAEREKQRLEQFYAEKLETERSAIRKDALERIAAIENTARVATRPESIALAGSAAPQLTAASDASPKEETDMTARVLLAYGIDAAKLNKMKQVTGDVARGLAPPPVPRVGDRWTYQREIRDGQGVTRRNYFTTSVTAAGDEGYTATVSDSELPARFDALGNRLSFPYQTGHGPGSGAVVFDPADVVFRFPLAAGQSYEAKYREVSGTATVRAEARVTVVGWEDVDVSAGTFRALKITKVANRSWEPFPGQVTNSKRVTNIWFVPGVRNIVKFEGVEATARGEVIFDQTWELDTFELN